MENTGVDVDERTGKCHCGGVRFRVTLLEGVSKPRRCNCSLCRMRGAVVVSARHDALHLTSGEQDLKTYRFNTRQAEHHFCARCGIYTHHRRRSNPDQISINVACLDGLSPFDFTHVPVYNGQVHPNDRPTGPRYEIAGYIDYISA